MGVTEVVANCNGVTGGVADVMAKCDGVTGNDRCSGELSLCDWESD